MNIMTEYAKLCFIYSLNKSGKWNDFFDKRKITIEDREKYGIGFSDDDVIINKLSNIYDSSVLEEYGLLIRTSNNYLYHPYKNRITFPIANKFNKVNGITARAIDNNPAKYIHTINTEHFKKGESLYLESYIDITKDELFLVEGPLDAIALNKNGYNAVASLGTGFSSQQVEMIKEYSKQFKIKILYDNDTAGVNATMRLLKELVLIAGKVYVINIEENVKDIDEYISSGYDISKLKTIDGRRYFFNNYFHKITSSSDYKEAYEEFIKAERYLKNITDGRIYNGVYNTLKKINSDIDFDKLMEESRK